jgi:hypothetical protein
VQMRVVEMQLNRRDAVPRVIGSLVHPTLLKPCVILEVGFGGRLECPAVLSICRGDPGLPDGRLFHSRKVEATD